MTTSYIEKLRMLNRDVRLMLAVYATAGFCYFGIITVIRNLYLLRLGYRTEFVGLFNGVSWLVATVSCLPAGAIGARWGSRRVMILGVGLIVVGYALLPLAEWLLPGVRAV